ncbi:hypothetical protein D3C80_1610080 [compost metagenome]
MQRLRGIAHQRQPMADMLAGGQQTERIAVPFAGLDDPAQPPAKRLLQLTDKAGVVPAIDLGAILTRMAPHQRTAALRHRQQRQWPIAGETFEGAPLRIF